MTYTIKLCGPSKDYFSDSTITLHVNDCELNPLELKTLLLENIKPGTNVEEAQSMLNSCLVSSEEELLNDEELLEKDKYLFLLPPVCGG